MKNLTRAILMALGTVGFVTAAQAGSYVVTANNQSFDNKLARKVEAAGGTITARLPQIGVAIVESNNSDFATRAARVPGIRGVDQDIVLQFDIPEAFEVSAHVGIPPNSMDDDIFYDLEWGMAAINAPGAWNAGYRGEGATVAVLDSGVHCTNGDLVPNLDLARSTSFVAGENVCDVGTGFNHGTHVAGTIAAADNGFGVIGVAPDATLFSVKVLSAVTGSGSFAGIIQGIVYAAENGADVINMSLGVRGGLPVNGPGANAVAGLVNATKRAVQFARKENALVVVSAGNDGRDLNKDSGTLICDGQVEEDCYRVNLRAFPAQLPGALAISATAPIGWGAAPATTPLDNLASYSNYGSSAIAFAGPGGDFLYFYEPGGRDPCVIGGFNISRCYIADYVISDSPGGFYFSAGTSMAAPHVSGVAALIIGKNGGEMSPAAVEAALRASADDLGKPGKDDAYGHGRVNAARAVQ